MMVEQCCRFVEQTPDLAIKLKLIDTLRTVTDGKVHTHECFFLCINRYRQTDRQTDRGYVEFDRLGSPQQH